MRIDYLSASKVLLGAFVSAFLYGCAGEEAASTSDSGGATATSSGSDSTMDMSSEYAGAMSGEGSGDSAAAGGGGYGGGMGDPGAGGHGATNMASNSGAGGGGYGGSGAGGGGYGGGGYGGAGMGDPGSGGHGGAPAMSGEPGMEGYADTSEMMDVSMTETMNESMTGGYGAGYGGGYAGGPGGGSNNSGRPADVRQWTDEQLLEAVDDRDAKVVQAIQARAMASNGDPAFVQLMTQTLAKAGPATAGAAPAVGGQPASQPGFPAGLTPGQSGPVGQSLVPPGGAFMNPRDVLPPSRLRPLDSMEIMIGEALLSYVPQAAQGVRGAADRTQDAAAGSQNSTSAAYQQAMQQNSGSPGSGQGYPGSGQGYPGPGQGYSGSGQGAPGTAQGYPGSGQGYPGSGQGYPGSGEGYPGAGYPGTEMAEGGMEGEYAGSGYGGANNQQRAGGLADKDLVMAVVHGLVINNSAQAWTALEGILNGTVSTPLSSDDATAVVLEQVAMAQTPDVARLESFLNSATSSAMADAGNRPATLKILTALSRRCADYHLKLAGPPDMQPAGGPPGTMQPETPNQMTSGYPGAGYPGAGATGTSYPGGGNPAGGYPGGGYPGGGSYPGGMEEMAGEGGYEQGGGFGMNVAGGQRGPQVADPLPPVFLPDAAMATVASILWSPAVSQAVSTFLESQTSAAGALPMVGFASTIPSDDVRSSLFSLMSRSHAEGPGGLVSGGLFQHVAHDPAMLTILKSLPRPKRSEPAPAVPGAPQPALAGSSWTAATQDSVLSLRDRMVGALADQTLTFGGNLPVRLHRDATAARSVKIDIGPNDQPLGDASPDKTTIYFSRVVATPQRVKEMQEIVEYYEKRTKGLRHEDRAKGLLWYDGVKPNSDGTVQSMDVIIEQLGNRPAGQGPGGYEGGSGYAGAGGGGAGGAVQFQIDVLVVITKDPSKASEALTTAATP